MEAADRAWDSMVAALVAETAWAAPVAQVGRAAPARRAATQVAEVVAPVDLDSQT